MDDRTEWLSWRHQGIGSSDASAIYDVNPWLSRLDLYNSKRQEKYIESAGNWATDRGNAFEIKARHLWAQRWNIIYDHAEEFQPKRMELSQAPFMRCSLDGISSDGRTLVEFKFQGKQAHEDIQNENIPLRGGRIKEHYWIQVQHQLLVSGCNDAYLVSYDGDTLHFHRIEPDTQFMRTHLEACSLFWNLVQRGNPPDPTERDYKPIKKKGATRLARRWKTTKLKIDAMSEELDSLREQILQMVDHDRMTCDGVRIVKYAGNKGSIDWQKAFVASNSELDPETFRRAQGKPFYKMDIVVEPTEGRK
jgi:putative phage-type endonuclease